MNINVKFNKNIKLKDLNTVNDLSLEILEYYPKADEVVGKLKLHGSYKSLKNNLDKLFNLELPFKVLIDAGDDEVLDVDCTHFEYTVLDNNSLELEYVIGVELENVHDDEEFKNVITDVMDEKLTEHVEVYDNEYSKVEESPNIKDKEDRIKEVLVEDAPVYSKMHIAYYDNDLELDKISEKYKMPINEVFKNTHHQDNKFKRVIIKK